MSAKVAKAIADREAAKAKPKKPAKSVDEAPTIEDAG